jgi:uncharacterized membrane-anchored protein
VSIRRKTRFGTHPAARDVVAGPAFSGKRTKDLAKQLPPGSIAVIDHQDLDRVAAEMLISAGVVAVVNAARSISGRYPNGGPIRLVEAGVVLLDDVGSEVLDAVDGGEVEIRGGALWCDGREIAIGTPLDARAITNAMEEARLGIGEELRRFAANTLEYIDREATITFEPLDLPPLRTHIRGRHALVVVRGHDYKTDLATLKPYIKEHRPVLIAVDGGADALLEIGCKPDIITGDFDSLTDTALRCGAELVHHVHPDGRAPGREELHAAGLAARLDYEEFVAEGMSEDVAMLLAYEAGATLIVAVGTHSTMVEMLDKGRRGMASTFLTRLRLGPVLVDAKGVHQLYEARIRRSDLLMLVVAAMLAIGTIMVATDAGHLFAEWFWAKLVRAWHSVSDWVS